MLTQTVPILEFKKPEIEDYDKIIKYISPFAEGGMCCEGTPITLFLWRNYYHQKIAFLDDMLFISLGEEQDIYLLPFAKDMEKAVNILKNQDKNINAPLVFLAADGERFENFKSVFGESYSYEESREDYEYIYSTQKLKDLKGKKFHSKRNHISAFTKANDWSYETITSAILPEIFEMADLWMASAKENSEDSQSIEVENAAIKEILPEMDQLNIKGGCIRVSGKIVAFTFGSAINSKVFDIHIEKALPEYRTAYTLINREFISHELNNFEFVNREDDMGLEGLRKAKLSYHPDILLKKYIVKER